MFSIGIPHCYFNFNQVPDLIIVFKMILKFCFIAKTDAQATSYLFLFF